MWLARLKRGLRQTEGPEFLAWLKRRSHRLAIAKAAVEWHGPEALSILSGIFPIPPAILQPRRGPRRMFLAAGAVAGVCITVLVPTGIVFWAGMHSQAYAATAQATQRMSLRDGTSVALKRGSQLDVIYAVRATSVSMRQGEALFKVASDPGRTFYVHALGQNFETRSAIFDVRIAPPQVGHHGARWHSNGASLSSNAVQ